MEEVNKLIKIANNHNQISPAMNNGAIEEINNYTILFSKRYIVVVVILSILAPLRQFSHCRSFLPPPPAESLNFTTSCSFRVHYQNAINRSSAFFLY